ncbi:Alpha-peptide [Drechslerella dactyloides]|uniref:Acetolactate synthase n=1 Tax=Drechslerella dactyloides TaxID=74499 RepID=A0AAD6IW05_DREDA|nr:Alpha-peptide [Drechslerella dactyloides]
MSKGAGHMAEGYARASGKPGVLIVTSGPGATNIVTPLQDALSDGIPLIAICGQVPNAAIGTDAFQEADVIGITRPCTKWNIMVRSVTELPRRLNEAFEIALSGRPGPVLIDVPKDVAASVLKSPISAHPALPRLASEKGVSFSNPPHHSISSVLVQRAEMKQQEIRNAIERSASLINIARKPIIYAGYGVLAKSQGPELLKQLADKSQIPVTTTLLGLGCFDELDEKSLGMLGMHGTAYANKAIQEADLIIALGARFDDRFAPKAKAAAAENRGGIIHFEIMPKNINKVVQATEAIEGDLADNLEIMLPYVDRVQSRPEWLGQIAEWKKRFPIHDYDRHPSSGLLSPQLVVEELSNLVAAYKDKVLITTGVGQHQMWAAQHYRWRYPRTMVTSGGLGTMGYGLPAAIGAKIARPESIVIDIDGDASLQMSLMELKTASLYNIPVKVIVINNGEQGMVTQWQSLFFDDRFILCHHGNPDFIKLAEAMGMKGMRVSKPSGLQDGLKAMLEYEGPVLLDVITDGKAHVLPMVPAGKALDECLVYDGVKDKERRLPFKKRKIKLTRKAPKANGHPRKLGNIDSRTTRCFVYDKYSTPRTSKAPSASSFRAVIQGVTQVLNPLHSADANAPPSDISTVTASLQTAATAFDTLGV